MPGEFLQPDVFDEVTIQIKHEQKEASCYLK